MDGPSTQADELAQWLRQIVQRLTQRELAQKFPAYQRTQWGEFLKGRKPIPKWLLQDLVTTLITSPQQRQLQLARGLELWEAAQKAALAKQAPTVMAPSGESLSQLHIRLDRARQAEMAAQSTLLGTTQIVHMLLTMVASLRERCSLLQSERDEALAQVRPDAAALQQHLAESRRRLAETQAQLTRARQEREQAEELRAQAQQIAEHRRRELEELHQETAPRPTGQDHDGITPPAGDPSAALGLPELLEYDRVLAATEERLEAHGAQMAVLRQQMKIPDPCRGEQARVVAGDVVRAAAADSADRPAAAFGGPSALVERDSPAKFLSDLKDLCSTRGRDYITVLGQDLRESELLKSNMDGAFPSTLPTTTRLSRETVAHQQADRMPSGQRLLRILNSLGVEEAETLAWVARHRALRNWFARLRDARSET
ncbi:hypothetical protein GXW83_24495 [Streptacidiphilus sp. PB12-B1b]|uniref:hypothetical protein n=1 Tax=Streptacidiphilus sp. PB12-B1b TaxID=2705012 RepID=UPI0015F9327B|nr:hypothetical protein [Streptacidiphilus sp. PB12-B1b]QMU78397.1 hypothetical protein GXW83_24495 [Streptacidiphilus sp. PB12-B1b]